MPDQPSATPSPGPDAELGLIARLHDEKQAYAGGEERPLEGYVAAMAAFGTFASVVALAAATRRPRATDISLADIALTGVATHKLTRIISKDSVTSPLRAPFTRYRAPGGPAELQEEVRGHGVRHAVGELITCPFCLGPWIATALTGGLVLAPRFTRAVNAVFTAVAVSDHLQLFYAAKQEEAG
jgi:hypothetical protein